MLNTPRKDATAEFDMIHPPDVVEKYVPDAEVVFWLLLTSLTG